MGILEGNAISEACRRRKGRAPTVEHTADTIVLIAVVDSLLQHVGTVDDLPPSNKVTMETVARGVSVCEDVVDCAGNEGVLSNWVKELVEDLDEWNRMSVRTFPATDAIAGPSHMVFVIGTVETPVTAGREIDLHA